MTKKTLEADFARYTKIITEGELWEIVDTGREDVKNNRVMDDIISQDKTEYSSHALAEVLDGNMIMTGFWSQDPGLVSDDITKIKKGLAVKTYNN